jgi:hypothetical protein
MHTATVHLKSVSVYSQSRNHTTEKLDKEGPDAYENRTWRERLHVNEDGYVYIPPMSFKNCISEVAKYIGMQIPGKGKATYTKHIEAGVIVMEPLVLPLKKEDVQGEKLFVPSDGRRGSGKRVWKWFPYIPSWEGTVTFIILDDTITKDVFLQHVDQAGKFIGIGRFRPRNNGFYGRFAVVGMEWE